MLFDIDNNSVDRGTPAPNTHDRLNPASVSARGTNSVNYQTAATFQGMSAQAGKNGQFTIVEVGNYTTTNAINIPNPGANSYGSTSTTIYSQPHGLSSTPAILGYEQNSGGQYTPLPYVNYTSTASAAVWYTFTVYVDATNVYINLSTVEYNAGVTFNPGFIFKWYLLYQTSN